MRYQSKRIQRIAYTNLSTESKTNIATVYLFNFKFKTLNNIASHFSIKDLENLSGIKAHTIRIWEKRYGVLEPDRSDTNIRSYSLSNLQKLLNISLLYKNGVKISKIASLNEDELHGKVLETVAQSRDTEHHLDSLKVSMLNFDQSLFEFTYNRLLTEASFRNVFLEVFVPMLQDIGFNWQSNNITPAHEHFISNLITQKLMINIERVQQNPPRTKDKTYVLYLPMNEIHEFGLLYIHYELLLRGYKSIYLGTSVPMDNLHILQKIYPEIHFISYFTVKPEYDQVNDYLDTIQNEIIRPDQDSFSVLGLRTRDIERKKSWENIHLFKDINNLLNKI